MNRETILSASDEQLNEWCAEKIWGWIHNPDYRAKTDKADTLWMNNKGKVLFSVAYQYQSNPLAKWEHIWHNYHPTTNIAQAIALLETLRDTRGFEWDLSSLSNNKGHFVATVWDSGFCNFVCYGDNSKEKAIVIASLLAVTEMEAQS